MNFKKFNFAQKRNGIIGVLNVLLGKIGLKFRIRTALDLRIEWVGNYVKNCTNNIVYSGLYEGMKLYENNFWSNKDISSKLLGVYELEVQEAILNSQKNIKKKLLINLGGGDGYHLVGLLKSDIFENSIVFEIDDYGRKIISKNLEINGQTNRVEIYSEANKKSFSDLIKKLNLEECFFLIDIEGNEYKLLDKEILNKLSNSNILIELHRSDKENLDLIENLKAIYNIDIFCTKYRDLSKFKFLHVLEDNDRWLSVSEHRPGTMYWVMCTPRLN